MKKNKLIIKYYKQGASLPFKTIETLAYDRVDDKPNPLINGGKPTGRVLFNYYGHSELPDPDTYDRYRVVYNGVTLTHAQVVSTKTIVNN